MDNAEKEAQELLPCTSHSYAGWAHAEFCPHQFRPAVAAKLREKDEHNLVLQMQNRKQGAALLELESQLAAANAEVERLTGKTTVAGTLSITLADHVNRCEVLIGDEQRKTNPDNALISALCDSIRLVREYVANVTAPKSQS